MMLQNKEELHSVSFDELFLQSNKTKKNRKAVKKTTRPATLAGVITSKVVI